MKIDKRTKKGRAFAKGKKFEKHCAFCEYVWVSRNEEVKQCPRCKRYFRKNTMGELLA